MKIRQDKGWHHDISPSEVCYHGCVITTDSGRTGDRGSYCRLISHLIKSNIKTVNPLTPNDPYRGCTAPLTSKRCILYIYSTNIGTEYFKYGVYSPFFSLQNAVCFIILTYLVPLLFTFYIQDVLKLKISGAKMLKTP